MSKIVINEHLSIDEDELREDFVRSSGPGGQNVNKVATTVQLHFDISASALPQAVRERLRRLGGRRVDQRDVLRLEARRFRTRERNRKDARDRMIDLIDRATQEPKPRKRTRPTGGSKRRRLEDKKRTGERKKLRRRVPSDDS